MNLKQIYILLLLFMIPTIALSQKAILKGIIIDKNNKPIANTHIQSTNKHISVSNKKGEYQIEINPNEEITIIFTHISYQSITKIFKLNKNEVVTFNPTLLKKEQNLGEVQINSNRNTQSKTIVINNKLLDKTPVTSNGAVEQILKTLPGVSSNNELSSQYSVRGGNFDENLVYINEIEIYRPNLIRSGQQEGLSIINPDLVSTVQFSSGGFDAKYGDKLSSVLDVKYKKPKHFEASAEASLLGSSMHFANCSKNKKLSYITGIRYKTNKYLLNTLDTDGEYNPKYTDIQALINYQLNPSISFHLWGSFSKNIYNFKPKERNTSFGTISNALQLKVYFDGKEKDEYTTDMQAASIKFHPNSNHIIRLNGNRYNTTEKENFDIIGQYYLSDLFVSQGGKPSKSIENLGVGTFIDHARNKLKKKVYCIDLKGDHNITDLFLQWGLGWKKEKINDKINEWQYQDSAGYSVPVSSSNVKLAYTRNAHNKINNTHYKSFVQASWSQQISSGELQYTAGLRYHYWDYNKNHFVSPRFSIHYLPNWNNKIKFRFSTGLYQQVADYRQMLTIDGQISTQLHRQKSIHYVLGQEYYFTAWNRPFKFSSELYYKDLQSVTPYDIENVRIRYYGNQKAKGYTTGLDLRINGEFIPGTESWASLSILKAKEDIIGDQKGFIPRPSDERFKFSMFFQDYLPNNPSYKMHISLYYGGKLPVWTPKKRKSGGNFRMPSYRRIDLGFSKILIDDKVKTNNSILKHFKSMWISLEVFNILDINNTISYLWINDISGNQYAIPNYLTSRRFNLKLSAKF